jgi:hypothetical protein
MDEYCRDQVKTISFQILSNSPLINNPALYSAIYILTASFSNRRMSESRQRLVHIFWDVTPCSPVAVPPQKMYLFTDTHRRKELRSNIAGAHVGTPVQPRICRTPSLIMPGIAVSNCLPILWLSRLVLTRRISAHVRITASLRDTAITNRTSLPIISTDGIPGIRVGSTASRPPPSCVRTSEHYTKFIKFSEFWGVLVPPPKSDFRATVQMVFSHRLPHRSSPGSIPGLNVGFVVNKVVLAQVFSEYFHFPCQFSFHQLAHYSLTILSPTLYGLYNESVVK